MTDTNTRVIIDVALNSTDANKKAQELGTTIKQVTAANKELKASGQQNDVAYVENAANLRVLQQEQKAYVALAQASEGSNNQLRAQLTLLTVQYNALSLAERDNTTAGQALQKQIKGISDELKVNESAIGDNRRSVGEYKKAILDANAGIEAQKKQLAGYTDFSNRIPAGFKFITDQVSKTTAQFNNLIIATDANRAAQVQLANAQSISNALTVESEVATKAATAIGFRFAAAETAVTDAEAAKAALISVANKALEESIIAEETATAVALSHALGDATVAETEAAKAVAVLASAAVLAAEAAVTEADTVATQALATVTVIATEAQVAKTAAVVADTAALAAQTVATEAQVVATETATAATGVFKIALASTGIGILLLAIGTLVTYFNNTNEGAKKVKIATAELNAVFQSIFKLITPLGKALSDAFSDGNSAGIKAVTAAIKLLLVPFATLFKVISDIKNGNFAQAFRDIGEGIAEFGKSGVELTTNTALFAVDLTKNVIKASDAIAKQGFDFRATAQAAGELTKERLALGKAEREFSTERIVQLGLADKLTLQLRQQNIAEEDRIKLALKAKTIRDTVFEQDLKFAQKNEELTQREQDVNSKKDFQAITDSKNRTATVIADHDRQAQAIENRQSKLELSLQKKAQAAEEARKKRLLKADEADKARVEALLKTIEASIQGYQKETVAVNGEIDAKIRKYKFYGATVAQLEIERTARLKQITDAYNKQNAADTQANVREIQDITVSGIKNTGARELAQLQLNTSRRLEDNTKAQQEVAKRIAAGEQGLEDLYKSFLVKRGIILTDDATLRAAAIKANYAVELEAYNQHELDLANARIAGSGSEAEKLAASQALLDLQYQQQIDNAVRTGQDTTLIAAQYDEQKKASTQAQYDAATEGFKKFSSSFQGLVGQNTVAYKLAGQVQAKIDAAVFT